MDLFHVLAGFGFFSLVLIALIVFVENGILFPFLPGDSLVFAGAIIAAAIGVHWSVVAGVAGAAAILGGEVGFTLGRRYGRQLFRSDARVLKRRYLVETERFFARWGAFAIVLARFVPIVRTYVAPAAEDLDDPEPQRDLRHLAEHLAAAGTSGRDRRVVRHDLHATKVRLIRL